MNDRRSERLPNTKFLLVFLLPVPTENSVRNCKDPFKICQEGIGGRIRQLFVLDWGDAGFSIHVACMSAEYMQQEKQVGGASQDCACAWLLG